MEFRAAYDTMMAQVAEIDAKLDLAGDVKGATSRTYTNERIAEQESFWSKLAESIFVKIGEAAPEQQVGMYFGLKREFSKRFDEQMSKVLTDLVEALPQPDESEKPTDAEIKALTAMRSELYKKVKAVKDLAELMDEGEGMILPKKRTGSRGKRGPRMANYITWSIEGNQVENGLNGVAELYVEWEKAKDLRAAMKEKGINLTNPDERTEFVLPDGKILVGIFTAPAGEDDDDDDETPESDDDE